VINDEQNRPSPHGTERCAGKPSENKSSSLLTPDGGEESLKLEMRAKMYQENMGKTKVRHASKGLNQALLDKNNELESSYYTRVKVHAIGSLCHSLKAPKEIFLK
jgi:hypothetical protein